MKAPDKIYLVENYSASNFIWDVEKWDDHRNFEYIRKDAMMEWLSASLEEMKKEPDNGIPLKKIMVATAISSFQEVIDKINSL